MLEPVTALTPRPVGWSPLTQWWGEVTFVHWALDPATVRPLLPPGTHPDTLDGRTYVGLVPFRMDRVGPLPYLDRFPETNVRLYTVDDQGRRGVLFRSVDAADPVSVLCSPGVPAKFGRPLRVAQHSGPRPW